MDISPHICSVFGGILFLSRTVDGGMESNFFEHQYTIVVEEEEKEEPSSRPERVEEMGDCWDNFEGPRCC